MLEKIGTKENIPAALARAKDKSGHLRLSGFPCSLKSCPAILHCCTKHDVCRQQLPPHGIRSQGLQDVRPPRTGHAARVLQRAEPPQDQVKLIWAASSILLCPASKLCRPPGSMPAFLICTCPVQD